LAFFPHLIKIFRATFPPHWTNHLQPLDVTVLRNLTAKYAGTQFIMKNILAGLKILEFGHFQEILLVMKILKRHLLFVMGIMNPLF
jgi:hypothetical protein